MRTRSKEMLENLTPELAIEILKDGNQRFVDNNPAPRNLPEQVNATATGQFPFATILSCIDSRAPAEIIFDQGLGDIFSIRVAGNILNNDILGSMEFACKLAGSKLIVVLGHTKCGAISGACNDVHLGHLTGLLHKIKPAIARETETLENRNAGNPDFVNRVSANNVFITVDQVRQQSEVLREMEAANQIKIIGALYDLDTARVHFYD